MRRYFVVRTAKGFFMTLGLRDGNYVVWQDDVKKALKFNSEYEADKWCDVNRVRTGTIEEWRY